MFCAHIYQKKPVSTLHLRHRQITKPSYLKQLTQVTETSLYHAHAVQELLLAYSYTLLRYCYYPCAYVICYFRNILSGSGPVIWCVLS